MRTPHHPARCRVQRARSGLKEELAALAAVEGGLSARPGTPPERRDEYWLGRIRVSAAYLLLTLDAEDAACGRAS
jgi:hypothetical protein